MNYWRMSMRIGNQGFDMFRVCRRKGIAALGYWHNDRDVVGDCRKLTKEDFVARWKIAFPRDTAGRKSVEYVAYEMKRGDVIYVKSGPMISGRGVVVGPYEFDPRILKGEEVEWPHFVRVKWDESFMPFRCLLGAEPRTVLKLGKDRLKMLQRAQKATSPRKLMLSEDDVDAYIDDDMLSAIEGTEQKHLVVHRKREASLRRAKVRQALRRDGGKLRCEVPGCGFDFEQVYGAVGKHYAQVHHLKPLGEVRGRRKTNLFDLAVVCANCHVMIHREGMCRPLESLVKSSKKSRR